MSVNAISILSIHRSGSSLFMNWLKDSGINIGQRLLEPSNGNILGHFEDLDFLSFHKSILFKNRTDFLQCDPKKIKIGSLDIKLANTLLQHKLNENSTFAWKDPRTCVFINSTLENQNKYADKFLFSILNI